METLSARDLLAIGMRDAPPPLPQDRAVVIMHRVGEEGETTWTTDLGVHLWVGRPEASLPTSRVRVWMHTKDCVTRDSPRYLKAYVEDTYAGRCQSCTAIPIVYRPTRAWWPWRLIVWLVRLVIRIPVNRPGVDPPAVAEERSASSQPVGR